MWTYAISHYPLVFLVMVRVTAFFVASPLLSVRAWPVIANVGLAGLVALWVAPLQPPSAVDPFADPGGYLLLALKEAVVGLLLGFLATLVFSVISMAGQMFDVQVGFNLATLLDQGLATGAQTAIGGMFLQVLFSLYFVAADGLDGMTLCILQSYRYVGVGAFAVPAHPWTVLTEALSMAMAVALEVAAPLLVALLLTDITFALLSRAVPQMNVFVVGLPVKLLVGLAVMAAAMPGLVYLFGRVFSWLFSELNTTLQWLGG
ncbi:flagellar biosynthetic protein FliR [Alicyclobacillus kakegawensis]|uniref:flagellar biosynthetic protein FliR n=1 Tax=Alicyclobacillus kakegawensis TaxID=392012 RepID=UPI0008307C40|nr:flagellar biosynthetic protein FliR [Alicyclobacillus kakegawensis]